MIDLIPISATPDFAERLAHLHKACFADGWSAEAFLSLLNGHGVKGILASQGGRDLGFALTRSVAREAEMLTFCVSPARRRQGLGLLLLSRTVEGLAREGAEALYLEVAESNLAARSLYGRSGFTASGRRPGYYASANGGEDALVLKRVLTA